jgi:hypothetical protein
MFAKHILAVRIYFINGGYTPMADLKFSDGVMETIEWTNVKQRKEFSQYINGYTLFYDERPKRNFNEW